MGHDPTSEPQIRYQTTKYSIVKTSLLEDFSLKRNYYFLNAKCMSNILYCVRMKYKSSHYAFIEQLIFQASISAGK